MTGWGMVRKIDRAEALEDFRRQVIVEGVAGGLLIMLLGGLLLVHRRVVMTRVLKQKEEKFVALLESAPDAIYIIEPSTLRILGRNRKAVELDGYSDEDIAHMPATDLHPPEDHTLLRERFAKGSKLDGTLPIHTLHHRRKDGVLVPVEETHTLVDAGSERLVLSIVRDITERKQAQEQLALMIRLYATLSQVNQAIVRAKEPAALYQSMCDIAVKFGGFALAWVGLFHPDSGDVRPVAAHGADVEQWPFEIVNIHRGVSRDGLVARAIRSREVVITEDAENDERMRETLGQIQGRGFHSIAVIPFSRLGETAGVLALVSRQAGFFKAAAEVTLLGEMGLDISFSLDAMAIEAQRKLADESLKESERQYRGLFQASPVAISLVEVICDAEGRPNDYRFLYVNPAFEQLVHAKAADIVGRTAFEFAPQSDRAIVERRGMVALTGVPDHFEGFSVVLDTYFESTSFSPRHGQCVTFLVDITERKRAEESLRESEARLNEAQHNAHIGSWRYVPGEPVVFSDEMYELYKLPRDVSPTYDVLQSAKHPEDRAHNNPAFQEAVESGALDFQNEFRIVWPDGQVRNVSALGKIRRDADGRAIEIVGTLQDITERKQAEAVLKETQRAKTELLEKLNEAQHFAAIGSWDWDLHTNHVWWSDETYRIFGVTPQDFVPSYESNGKFIHPDDFAKYTRSFEHALQTGEPLDFEVRLMANNGLVKHCQVRAKTISDDSGQPIRFIGTVMDITDRKRAEAEHLRLVTAIEQSAEAVMITNTSGNIEYVNPAFTRMTGYSREEVLGLNPRILKSEKQDPAFYQKLWATISKGEIWRGEVSNRKKDGSLFTEEMNIAPVRGELGEITHYIATKQDVTERRHLEEQFRQAQKMEAVGRLAGGIAHDFNNLLTIIIGYSEMAQEDLDPQGRTASYLAEILRAGNRAASLTRQLLAFSRQQVLAPRVLDLNALVDDVAKMLRRLLGEDIDLVIVPDSALGRVKADSGQIDQILMNLAVNARDAMPQGGKLTIETANVDLDEAYADSHVVVPPGCYVMLAMSDSGIGMDAETQSHIFEPFFTTKEKGKGTGLGLAMVYGTVKQSGGFIWVYSEPGGGTTFKIYLPRVEDADGSVQASAARGRPVTGSETILLVEDEEGLRALAARILQDRGYTVLESTSPEDALQIGERHKGPIDLLLTDVVMPKMSGRMIAEHLALLRPDMKVLYMSGYTDDASVHHEVREEGTAFLQKPFTPSTLAQKVREVLDADDEEET